jgi:cyanophycinase
LLIVIAFNNNVMKKILSFLFTFFSLLALVNGQSPKGNLMIVGGALSNDNKEVYEKMIELSGGASQAKFAVIPSASGVPAKAFESFSKTLVAYGVKPENIILINVAMLDDDSTPDANEKLWAGNASDHRVARAVRSCSAVWFTGGDQLRTIMTLTQPDGSPTKVLEAVWEVYMRGGLVGGSSAGAAIMGPVMIGRGSSAGAFALSENTNFIRPDLENAEAESLLLTCGLGFFPEGITDQHFNQRARLGRLAAALSSQAHKVNKAFGIDENTALYYSAADRKITVIGENGVTILDASEAVYNTKNKIPSIAGLNVSYLEDGDVYLLNENIILPAAGKLQTAGAETYSLFHPAQAGILASSDPGFRELISRYLINNRQLQSVYSFGFNGDNGVSITFTKTPESRGYVLKEKNGKEKYTITNIRMDITPVKVRFESFQE